MYSQKNEIISHWFI